MQFFEVNDNKLERALEEAHFRRLADPATLVIVGGGQENLARKIRQPDSEKTLALPSKEVNPVGTQNAPIGAPKKVTRDKIRRRTTSRPARYVPPPEGEMARVTLDWYRQNDAVTGFSYFNTADTHNVLIKNCF